ncbi:hypothetical protein DV737_g540, partial [Chaetothyriales sp. CBS 132003]
MESFKAVFFKPDPRVQQRKCEALIRQNKRELDKSLVQLRTTQAKFKLSIKQDARKMQGNPALAKPLRASIQALAKEIAAAQKHEQRLITNKAQLDSVLMQVHEAFAMRKIEGSLRSSTAVMREVNTLTKLPELSHTMQLLSQELIKAGVIEEMVGDMLPDDDLLEDEVGENEAEINNIIKSALTDKEAAKFFGQAEERQTAFPAAPPDAIAQEEPDTELGLATRLRGGSVRSAQPACLPPSGDGEGSRVMWLAAAQHTASLSIISHRLASFFNFASSLCHPTTLHLKLLIIAVFSLLRHTRANMSGRLDQSLDSIIDSQKKAKKEALRRRKVAVKVKAPVGGVKKTVKPAKPAVKAAATATQSQSSKIVVSGLPFDVNEAQIKEYFIKTVGPVKKVSVQYNQNGQSRGIADVIFGKPGLAAKAAKDQNGMLIEVIVDARNVPEPPKQGKLADRVTTAKEKAQPKSAVATKPSAKAGAKAAKAKKTKNAKPKAKSKTVDELDAEMADYFTNNTGAAAAATTNGGAAPAAAGGEDLGMDEIS